MTPLITVLIGAAVGFALGCKYKDVLFHKTSEKASTAPIGRPSPMHVETPPQRSRSEHTGFPLSSIKHIFDEYNMPLDSSNSFILLLDTIKQESYLSLLKEIINKVSSPKDLFDFLKQESFNVKSFSFSQSQSGPYMGEDELSKIILQENVKDTNLLTEGQAKVEFLLALYQAKGTKRFEESFGRDLRTFIELYEKGDDTSTIYNSLIETMKRRVDILS